jgi:hypothetical protein
MPSLLDFIFGSGALKQAAAQGGTPPVTATPSQPAGIDVSKLAQQQADQALKKKKPPVLATPPAAPALPALPARPAGTMQKNLMGGGQ